MYDDIKRQIALRVSEGPRFSIERISPHDTCAERGTSLISAHVASALEHHIKEMHDDVDASKVAALPRDAVREFGGLRTQRQLKQHLVERVSVDLNGPMKAFDFTVSSGSRILGPPYDLEWTEGNGIALGGRVDGKVFTIPTRNGFSAAGIGFHLSTNVPALAALTPQGTYDWNWVAFADLPFARSRGGMGITIYTNSESQPTLSRQPVLWSASGMTMFSGQKGSGRIADAASPAFGLGAVTLAPALINMVPGSRYLVWVWCWQTSRLEENDPFIAFLNFFMPFLTVDAGPPIVIH